MRKVKSVFFKGTIALILLGAISTPAQAATLPLQSNNSLSQVINQLNQQLNSLRDYLNKTVVDKLKPLSESLGKDIEQVVSEATGALGLPDPTKSRNEVEKAAATSDNPINSVEQATNEVDRLLTRAAVNATLGEDGQQQQQQQAQQTQNSVNQVAQQAQAAQQAVSTQDVVKAMAQQNTEISSVLGSLRADSLQAAQNQQLTNLNLTNISRSLDGQNQAKQSEVVGTGLDTFRTAARARLF